MGVPVPQKTPWIDPGLDYTIWEKSQLFDALNMAPVTGNDWTRTYPGKVVMGLGASPELRKILEDQGFDADNFAYIKMSPKMLKKYGIEYAEGDMWVQGSMGGAATGPPTNVKNLLGD